jgi:hypothetical protein
LRADAGAAVSALPTRGNNTNHNNLRQLDLGEDQFLSHRGGRLFLLLKMGQESRRLGQKRQSICA